MEAYAIHKSAIIAPRKARMTIDLVRGKKVDTARAILETTNTKASRLIMKVLNSAVANATNNLELNEENLYVKEAYINEGRTLKRGRAGAKGRPDPILKRSSHITVVVADKK